MVNNQERRSVVGKCLHHPGGFEYCYGRRIRSREREREGGPDTSGCRGGDTATPTGTFRAGAMGAGRGRGREGVWGGQGENVRERERGRHRRLIRGHTDILPRR